VNLRSCAGRSKMLSSKVAASEGLKAVPSGYVEGSERCENAAGWFFQRLANRSVVRSGLTGDSAMGLSTVWPV
jgi:hypothetical protein